MQAEDTLYAGYYSDALSILSGITATNNVESNYLSYYSLYAGFMQYGTLSGSDSTTLYNLAVLCPAEAGACVHQARALYNYIYNAHLIYEGCNGGGGVSYRMAPTGLAQQQNKQWDVGLYPNPADNAVTLVSKNESEVLNVIIKDMSGRTLLQQSLKTSGFMANLELPLANGAYLATITNSRNEKLIKKLLIAK